ncbi:MAG: hypothetical protein ATN36_07890 [Epulopiscium sp. Nele67-Bin005]|nr:MAG: hypothetical protein ATN36_07890 [Epulopiscium sp. Nele67-Bin005]
MRKLLAGLALGTLLVGSTPTHAFSFTSWWSQPAQTAVASTQVTVNEVTLEVGANFTSEVAYAVGTPVSVVEAPSCHFEGTDTIYTYEDFAVYTYQQDGANKIYIIEMFTENVATPEGATVGMTVEQVAELHGTGYTREGNLVTYSDDVANTAFYVNEYNVVTGIEIF